MSFDLVGVRPLSCGTVLTGALPLGLLSSKRSSLLDVLARGVTGRRLVEVMSELALLAALGGRLPDLVREPDLPRTGVEGLMFSLVFAVFVAGFGVIGIFLEFVECFGVADVCANEPFFAEPGKTRGELLSDVEFDAKISSRLELQDFWNDEADLVE